MRLVVVGGNGFLGQAMTKELRLQGHDVKVVSRANYAILKSSLLELEETEDDLVVIWAASSINPLSASSNPKGVESDLETWNHFVGYLRSRNLSEQVYVVFLSSGGCVYSENKTFYRENDLAQGSNEYGRLKSRQEDILLDSGMKSSILRVANVFGPGQPANRGQGVIAEWTESIQRDGKVKVFGSLEKERDFLFVLDFVSAIVKTVNIKPNGIFNIGSGVATRLSVLLETLQRLMNRVVKVELLEGRQVDRMSYLLDITKAGRELNWIPKYSLERGLEITIGLNMQSFP